MVYRTREGDRWDQISMMFYGHPDYYKEIIKANPYLPDEIKYAIKLPGGLIITVPDIEKKPVYPEELPPWKRK